MNKVKSQLDIYISFRNLIKSSIRKITSNGYYIVAKEDILKWKKYSLYSLYRSCNCHNNDLNKWESKFQEKKEEKEPQFKILTEIKDIKKKLKNGISIIQKEFLKSLGYNIKKEERGKEKEITYHILNNKIILDIQDKQNNHYLICKIGKRQLTKYIIFNCVKNSNNIIPKILNSKSEEELLNNSITTSNKEVIELDSTNINKYKNEINIQTTNSNIIKENNYIKDNKNSLILETLILIYGFNKSIKAYKSKISQKLFLINYDWIKALQEFYDYSKIIKELQNKCQSYSYSDYEQNLRSLIKSIKEVEVNNNIDLLKNISIIPEKETFYESYNHYIKFILVNNKINERIKKIVNYNINQISFDFYCCNKIIYNDSNFIEIGYLDSENAFISEYYLSIKYKDIKNELKEIFK